MVILSVGTLLLSHRKYHFSHQIYWVRREKYTYYFIKFLTGSSSVKQSKTSKQNKPRAYKVAALQAKLLAAEHEDLSLIHRTCKV